MTDGKGKTATNRLQMMDGKIKTATESPAPGKNVGAQYAVPTSL